METAAAMDANELRRAARVLVVDDDERNLFTLAAALEPLGVTVVRTTSGQEALLLLLRYDFAVVLLDVRMPDVGGLETAALLRQRTRSTPIIFVSGLADAAEIRRGYEAGAVDYIVKPFDALILRSKVSVLVELWEARELVRRSKELLQRSSQEAHERERFIGVLAHDLRNPLAAVSMAAQVLAASQLPENSALARRIKRSADRMARMIGDVLDFARGRLAGGIPLSMRSCDLAPVCEGVVSELRDAYPAREIGATVEHPLHVEADADRVAQALSNLLGNALQHSTGHVQLAAIRRGATVSLTVHNTGKAIPPERVKKLFEPFRRDDAESSSPRTGLGLGLFIVSEITRAHGGTVEVVSDERGTAFTIHLPVEGPAAGCG